MKSKYIRAIALALGISASSLFLTSCGEKEHEASVLFSSILDDTKDSTLLDEILEEKENKDITTEMFVLEKYLVLSEKLHTLNFDNFKEIESDENLESLDLSTRVDKLEAWERNIGKLEHLAPTDEEYNCIVKKLKNSEVEINSWLYDYGYSTTIKMASLVSKAKLVDAFSLDMNEYKNFSILENPENFHQFEKYVKIKYTDHDKKSEYYYDLEVSSLDETLGAFYDEYYENKLAQMVYVVSESKKLDGSKVSKDAKASYDEELNSNLKKFTEIIKRGMYAKFTVEDGKIYQIPENEYVNGIYDAKIKSLNKK
ncbi:MAG: hypothetical protein HFJ12_06290 [Bacilli bacterium]|nr:hypothetical protein [Bacilli bacterium]